MVHELIPCNRVICLPVALSPGTKCMHMCHEVYAYEHVRKHERTRTCTYTRYTWTDTTPDAVAYIYIYMRMHAHMRASVSTHGHTHVRGLHTYLHACYYLEGKSECSKNALVGKPFHVYWSLGKKIAATEAYLDTNMKTVAISSLNIAAASNLGPLQHGPQTLNPQTFGNRKLKPLTSEQEYLLMLVSFFYVEDHDSYFQYCYLFHLLLVLCFLRLPDLPSSTRKLPRGLV